MADAVCGDDVYGDDPTVAELQRRAASMLGKEAALFVPSGTMGNCIAVGLHSRQRHGAAAVCGDSSHLWMYEVGGASQFWGLSLETVATQPDGRLALGDIAAAVRDKDEHYPVGSKHGLERNRACVLHRLRAARWRPAPPHRTRPVAPAAPLRSCAGDVDGVSRADPQLDRRPLPGRRLRRGGLLHEVCVLACLPPCARPLRPGGSASRSAAAVHDGRAGRARRARTPPPALPQHRPPPFCAPLLIRRPPTPPEIPALLDPERSRLASRLSPRASSAAPWRRCASGTGWGCTSTARGCSMPPSRSGCRCAARWPPLAPPDLHPLAPPDPT